MTFPARVGRAWRALHPDQRLAAVAAIAVLLSMLLPWYEVTTSFTVGGRPQTQSVTRSAFGVYSFVEAAIFLVAVAVLVLLFARGERRAFHLPGGDGTVIMAAGLWVMFLIFFRQLDKPNIEQSGAVAGTVGVAWGIFVAFLCGALLAYAGWRIRAAHVVEPPLPQAGPSRRREPRERPPVAQPPAAPDPPTAPTRRVPRPAADPDAHTRVEGQLSFDEPPPVDDPAEYRPPPRRDQRSRPS
jgi:hypothetical protein